VNKYQAKNAKWNGAQYCSSVHKSILSHRDMDHSYVIVHFQIKCTLKNFENSVSQKGHFYLSGGRKFGF